MDIRGPGCGRPGATDIHTRMVPCFMFIHEGAGCFFVCGWVYGFMDVHGWVKDFFFFLGDSMDNHEAE